ncbi:NUDIX hydrolase [Lacticaseibacillus zhaodongensis]|uniref:NUDIX hydrolase n=1 Tax=Lacticaseibacillus zhaodongensis TaxID=2668065 RepID=UPI0012D2FF76|nr:NUDIX hydrolase [Lacticaseibacillus zhaodongensis]
MIDFNPEPGKILSSKTMYNGPIFKVRQQQISTPDGLTIERDLIDHGPAAVILAMTPDGKQALLGREYRVGVNREAISLPAGLINPGESPEEAAKRELGEETGYVATDLRELLTLTASEGMTNETQHCFLATIDPAKRINKHFDADEFVSSSLVDFADIITAIRKGQITSAQTIATVSYYCAFVANK